MWESSYISGTEKEERKTGMTEGSGNRRSCVYPQFTGPDRTMFTGELKNKLRGRKMVQWTRSLPEDLGSIPKMHMATHSHL